MVIELSEEADISDQSHAIWDGGLVTYGPLVLDTGKRILSGPGDWLDLHGVEVALLLALMRPQVVSTAELVAAAFPGPKQPWRREHALAVRISRLRRLLETVGVSGSSIRAFPRQGYGLGLGGVPARTYTGKRVRMLDALLRTHPDQEAVAELDGLMGQVS